MKLCRFAWAFHSIFSFLAYAGLVHKIWARSACARRKRISILLERLKLMKKLNGVVGAACGLMWAAPAFSSNLDIYGTLDLAVTHMRTAGQTQTGLGHSGSEFSRLGLRGREGLGSGFATGFTLEAGLIPNQGKTVNTDGIFSLATLSLFSPYGELRIGRDDSVTFLNSLLFDPFAANGVGTTNSYAMLDNLISVNNAVSYVLPPDLGGFYGQFQHASGPTHRPGTGNYRGVLLGYAQGALDVAVASAVQQDKVQPDLVLHNLALSYNFGSIKPSLILAQEKRGSERATAYLLGVSTVMGAHLIRASVGKYESDRGGRPNDWLKFSVGYGYNLSKSTQLYASYAYMHNQSDSAQFIRLRDMDGPSGSAGRSSQGYQFGIRKFF